MNNENKTTTLEQWLEKTTSVKMSGFKITKLAKNQDVIIFTIINPLLQIDNLMNSYVYFYKSKKIQECETFEGAMHLYFY